MTVKTKVITRNNEVDDFLKELLGKVHYIAQSANNVLIKNFSYLSDKLSYHTFNQVDKNAPRIMEALVFENKRMITLFFKPNIYDDTKNDCHNSELSYFCQLKDGVLYIPEKIDAIELKKRYSFSRDIKLFFKKEYKNRCIRSVKIVNNDNFFFEGANILPYQFKLYYSKLSVEKLSENNVTKILGNRKFPSLSNDDIAKKAYTDICQLQMDDMARINIDYEHLLIPEFIELTHYEAYGFIEKEVIISALKDGGIKFLALPDFKFQKFGSILESNVFVSKAELYNVLSEMAISQINELENRFLPSRLIENKEKFLQLMSELYDREVEVKKEIFNLFNTEFNETLQQLSAIVDKNKTDNIV
jgi:hypothetical protein